MSIAEAQAVAAYLDIDGDGMIEASVRLSAYAIPSCVLTLFQRQEIETRISEAREHRRQKVNQHRPDTMAMLARQMQQGTLGFELQARLCA